MSIALDRFHKAFFEECFEGLDVMEQSLLQLEDQAHDPETINSIFRAAHSIKGGAATFGFAAIADYTHGVETLLDRMRAGVHPVRPAEVALLLRVVDVLRNLLLSARDAVALDEMAIAETQAALTRLLDAKPVAVEPATKTAPSHGGWHIVFAPETDLFRTGNDPLHIFRELETLGPLHSEVSLADGLGLKALLAEDCRLTWTLHLETSADEAQVREAFAWVEDQCQLEISPLQVPAGLSVQTAAAASHQAEKPTSLARSRTEASSSIRVSTDKIDALINLVGELVITQAMLTQTGSTLDPVLHEKMLAALNGLDRNTRLLQESVMSIRMLPVESVFARFPRMVHDLAAKLGKQVQMVTVGEHTELDKGVIEKIADPLTHLVRNALDHGLETPEQRQRAGKSAMGTVRLSAAHQGGHIIIQIADDGRGLDRERILAKARERELPVSAVPADAEVWQLIFASGFSTAESVTDVSGRGVGMDVVKKNIQSLGGHIELASKTGLGTTVTIRLPLTLAILDGMSVAVADELYVVPLNCVVESLQPRPQDIKTLSGEHRVLRVRGEFLPLVSLHALFAIDGPEPSPQDSVVVIIEGEGRRLALLVDQLVGQQQVVIKSLETNYRRVRGVSGATIMGDGRVALILDPAGLTRTTALAA